MWRLIERSERTDTGCLRWAGAHTPKGYGQMRHEGRTQAVHRLAHEAWIGPIPDGYEVDHLCGVRDCIEPTHLEAVTHAENVRRQLASITHCPSGHAYTPENTVTYVTGRGYPSRKCRTCKNARHRAYKKGRRHG